MIKRSLRLLFLLSAIASIIGAWYLASSLQLAPSYALPVPHEVLRVIVAHHDALLSAGANTLFSALAGFIAATLFGLASGFLMHRSKELYQLSMPVMVVIKSTPVVAVVPLFSLAFGVGTNTKLLLTFFTCFFPMVISVYTGLNSVPKGLADFAHAVKTSPIRYVLFVELPCAGSQLILGMKITLPLAFVGAVVAEMAGGDEKGIGHLVITSSYHLDTPMLYASLLFLAAISAGSFYLLGNLAAAYQHYYWEAS